MKPERRTIAAAFSAAAGRYDASAPVQARIAEALSALSALAGQPGPGIHAILDAGCGTGSAAPLLARHWPGARVTGLDLAGGMTRLARPRLAACVQGDLEALPFAAASFDLVWSSLAWQWCAAPRAAAEAARVLRPGGRLLLATLGNDTLHEVATAFAGLGGPPRVRTFCSMDELQSALLAAGFSIRTLRREHMRIWAPSVRAVLDGVRAIGAGTLPDRPAGLMGRQAWQAVQAAYDTLRTADGLPATYDAVFIDATTPS